jgi:hypothetical protein
VLTASAEQFVRCIETVVQTERDALGLWAGEAP